MINYRSSLSLIKIDHKMMKTLILTTHFLFLIGYGLKKIFHQIFLDLFSTFQKRCNVLSILLIIEYNRYENMLGLFDHHTYKSTYLHAFHFSFQLCSFLESYESLLLFGSLQRIFEIKAFRWVKT